MSEETLRSFKDPWLAEKAKDALDTAGIYEAGGNAVWINPHPPSSGDELAIAGEAAMWTDIEELVATHWVFENAAGVHTKTKGTGRQVVFLNR